MAESNKILKKKFLTISEKADIVKKFKNGVSKQTIIEEHGVIKSTLNRIIRNSEKIVEKSESFDLRHKKLNKTTPHEKVEKALLTWFIQKRDSGQPVSGIMLQKKAVVFNELLSGPPNFKASDGWFTNFKTRHGIRRLSMKGEKLSDDSEAGKEFSETLKEKIATEKLILQNIYNADESGLYWKILLDHDDHTYALSAKESASGFKVNEDRFTALFCSNATGNHRISLLIIGKSAKPHYMQNLLTGKPEKHQVKYIPAFGVAYSSQSSGWINCEIFENWFMDEFIPRVLNHQKETGIGGKVLLILDNAPSHPTSEELNKIHSNFEVMFLPPNVTAFFQPMNQSPIPTTKKLYKNFLMEKLLNTEDHNSIKNFLKSIVLGDAIVMLNKAWSEVKQSTLQNAWNQLLGKDRNEDFIIDFSDQSQETKASVEPDFSVAEQSSLNQFCDRLTTEIFKEECENGPTPERLSSHIREWFGGDEDDCGWEYMTDDIIVQNVQNSTSSIIVGENSVDSYNNENHEEKQDNPFEVYKCFQRAKKYAKMELPCSEAQIQMLDELDTLFARDAEEKSSTIKT